MKALPIIGEKLSIKNSHLIIASKIKGLEKKCSAEQKPKKGLEKKLTMTTFHQVHVCHVDTIPQLNNVLTFCIFTVTFVFSPHLLHLCVVSITSLSPTLNTFFFFFTLFFIFMSNYSHINEKSYCFAVPQASSGKKLWWEYIAAKQFCCFGFKKYIYFLFDKHSHAYKEKAFHKV